MNDTFKHCHITKHPLKDEYMVVNDTFPDIPPYFGSLSQCKEAAMHANMKAEELLNKLIDKARAEGHSEEEINKAVQDRLKRDFRANESISESNLRIIVESTYRGLVTECMNKKIEEKRELVHSIVSEMVYRSLKEGIKLREEDIDDDYDDDENPTADEIAAERADSQRYFSQFAKPKPEEKHEEGDVIDYDGFKIEKKNGVYTFVLSENPKSIIYSASLNKLKENLDYIFSSVDPKERAAKLKEFTGTPYLCKTFIPDDMVVSDKTVIDDDSVASQLGFEINLDGFGYPNKWARK